MVKIKQHVADVMCTARGIVDTMRAGRSDLQVFVTSVAYYLLARLGSFDKVDEFLADITDTAWKVYIGTKFYAVLKDVCVNAAIISREGYIGAPCAFVIENKGALVVCERDKRLAALILLFDDKFEYVRKSVPECNEDGVPVQLSSELRLKHPVVFLTTPVRAPRHFL